MAVPSTNQNGVIVRTGGYGEAFYNVLTEDKGAYESFEEMCRGGELLKRAQEKKKKNRGTARDVLRGQVAELLKEKLSKAWYHMLYFNR
jgi:hypothetical protein